MAPTNWDNLVRDSLAPIFRQSHFLGWLRALVGGVIAAPSSITRLYTELLSFREICLRRASTSGELIRMEIQLNRFFIGTWSPTVTPPITLERRSSTTSTPIGRRADDSPVIIGRRADSRPWVIGRRVDGYAVASSLVVRCPLSLLARRTEIIAELERYIPAAVTYTITFY
jgi:hypothetical protein